MPQMVLPQTPAPGMSKDMGPSKAGNSGEAGAPESRYDSVSRVEQDRLERKRAERSEESQSLEDARQADRLDEKAESSDPVAKSSEASRVTTPPDSEPTDHQSEDDEAELTFVGLQSLFVPAAPASDAAGTSGSGAVGHSSSGQLPGVLPGSANSGKSGQALPGVTQGLQLSEAVMGAQGAESSRPVDSASIAASARFQAAMDMASQQAGNQAARMAQETAVPLRSYTTSVAVPVGHAEWGDKVAGKLSFLTARNMSVAEIHLTPPDMGPMEVKVKVHNEQANITVHAANPVVRDQLELHSHRLRDMLGEQGLSLAQFDVSDSPQQQAGGQASGNGDGDSSGQNGFASGSAEVDGDVMESGSLDLSWKGEVDIFA